MANIDFLKGILGTIQQKNMLGQVPDRVDNLPVIDASVFSRPEDAPQAQQLNLPDIPREQPVVVPMEPESLPPIATMAGTTASPGTNGLPVIGISPRANLEGQLNALN